MPWRWCWRSRNHAGTTGLQQHARGNRARGERQDLKQVETENERTRAAEAFPNATVHVDYHELLRDPEIEAVDVVVPNHLHDEVGVAALDAGKNVLLEKPMATSVEDAEAIDLETLGPKLEQDPLFPERANIGVAQIVGPERLRFRVWERGVGITRACGSGACAAVVAAARRGLTGRRATVVLDGGELDIEWRDDNHVLMTGPTTRAFSGTLGAELLA